MRASRPTTASTRRLALVVLAPAGVSALLAIFVAPVIQVCLAAGAVLSATSIWMGRLGRVLNPAWVIVVALYLMGPVGSVLTSLGIGVSLLVLVVLALTPFVVIALLVRPGTRGQLMLLAPLLLLLGLTILSLLWTSEPSYGIEKVSLWLLTGVLPAGFILVLRNGSQRVSWHLIAGAAFLSAIALIAFGAALPLYPGRVTAFGANPIWAARAAFVGALVVLFGPFRWLVKLSITPVMIVAGLMTLSLGPALGLVIGTLAGVVEALRHADRADRRAAAAWITLGLSAGLVLAAYLAGAFDATIASLSNVVGEANITSRATYLAAAGTLFSKAPLLGVGIGGFASTGLDTYPHNLVAEVGAELGALGVLPLVAWIVLALRGAAGSPVLVALVFATGVYSLFSGSLATNAEFWLFSALAVATLSVDRHRVTSAEPIATDG